MNINGTFKFTYKDEKTANYVGQLIQVDNSIALKSLKINTYPKRCDVITELSSQKVSTFFSTVDDLFFSEKLITNMIKLLR